MSCDRETAIVILAGGRATRLPRKLEQNVGGEPMLVRVCRNARATGLPVYVAGSAPFVPPPVVRLDAPLLSDRWPGAGPLRALLSACEKLAHARVFALAGDEPLVTAELLLSVANAWEEGIEAVVPRRGDAIEPLAALYDRAAVVREARAALQRGDEGMRSLVGRLKARFVPVAATYFANVNTPADLRRVVRTSP